MHERPSLGAFLRARRERVQPGDVGLPATGRRRTPGLRREELATLANVSIDYLVRLEQGRDVNPSRAVLASVASALRLDADERAHLIELATTGRAQPEPTPPTAPHVIPPAVLDVVDRLDPTPAFVVGGTGEVLASNRTWDDLVRPLGMLDDPPPHVLRYTFVNPRAQQVYVDWSDVADAQVAALRHGTVRAGPSADHDALIGELMSVPEFAARWLAHDVGERCSPVTRIVHPAVGELRFTFQALAVPGDELLRLASWLPADSETASGLLRAIDVTTAAVGRPGA